MSGAGEGDEYPAEQYCPISQELMVDPVIAEDGHTYERREITEWFKHSGTSPITRERMEMRTLVPNHALRKMIEDSTGGKPAEHPAKKDGVTIALTGELMERLEQLERQNRELQRNLEMRAVADATGVDDDGARGDGRRSSSESGTGSSDQERHMAELRADVAWEGRLRARYPADSPVLEFRIRSRWKGDIHEMFIPALYQIWRTYVKSGFRLDYEHVRNQDLMKKHAPEQTGTDAEFLRTLYVYDWYCQKGRFDAPIPDDVLNGFTELAESEIADRREAEERKAEKERQARLLEEKRERERQAEIAEARRLRDEGVRLEREDELRVVRVDVEIIEGQILEAKRRSDDFKRRQRDAEMLVLEWKKNNPINWMLNRIPEDIEELRRFMEQPDESSEEMRLLEESINRIRTKIHNIEIGPEPSAPPFALSQNSNIVAENFAVVHMSSNLPSRERQNSFERKE